MLNELSKKDNLWRSIAFKIAKDKQMADDIVQDMYLKLMHCKKPINDYYITLTMRSIFIDYIRKNKECRLFEDYQIKYNCSTFEPTDEEQKIIDSCSNIDWWQKELLEDTYDRSYRQIAKYYKINYNFVFKKVKEARKIILNG